MSTDTDQTAAARGVRALAAALVRGHDASANLVVSPSSIAQALGLALAGARGGTAREIAAVLGGAGIDDTLRALSGLRDLDTAAADANEPTTLRLASAAFGAAGLAWDPTYLDRLARWFDARPETVDFAADANAAREQINTWVARRTADRIRDLVPPGAVQALTRLVLVNAVHFKAPWSSPFLEQATTEQPFHLGEESVLVPTMRSTSAAAAVLEDVTLARLPYAGHRFALTIALREDPAALLADLGASGDAWERLTATPVQPGVDLSLPRWQARTNIEVSHVLRAMGVRAAFGRDADFTAMTGENDLRLDAVLHQGWIDVAESGTEAAAATAVVMRGVRAVVRPGLEVVVDRPFAWCLHDLATGVPVFVGWVADPRA